MSRLYMLCIMLVFLTGSGVIQRTAAEDGVEDAVSSSSAVATPGYALIMSNGMKLRVSEYCIDLEKDTVFFKSNLSGLSATFPLERIQRVVSFDSSLLEIPDDAQPLFIPENTVGNSPDDGGIPVLFKVNKTVVGSSGSAGGYTRPGSTGASRSDRQSYSPSKSSGRTSSSSSSGYSSTATSGSSGRTTSSSSSRSETDSSANNFFDALFGGK